MSELNESPLRLFHERRNARMVPFAGWSMPVQYSSIIDEHKAVREKAGLFDASHMGEILVEGKQAEAFLEKLVSNAVAPTAIGKAVYTVMCYENGTVVDDLIIYRRGDDRFLLCVNASNTEKDLAWIQKQSSGFDCTINDVSSDYGLLALQGPLAAKIVTMVLTWPELESLPRFHFIEREWSGIPLLVSRTGYTGEDGFEIFCPVKNAEIIAEAIITSGEPMGLLPCGLGSRDSLRLEAGYPLYGHEISDEINPLSGGLGWVVKLKKEADFIGKKALSEMQQNGLQQKVIHFILKDRRIAREGMPVKSGDKTVGKVVSGTHSPMLNAPIGSALVDSDAIKAGNLTTEIRGKSIDLEVVKPPLYKKPG
jgi:aminomethyltransferase